MAELRPSGTRNRLGQSDSLYLRQHGDNPVHWQPWDDDAFALASGSNKPILLSIGYAACHWCHVMAQESFADPATAALMNELFICIKVDREERPDLDRFYLAAVARLGRPAGWPLTAFLVPDGTPFSGGGYFPPEPRFGLPAFREVLREAAASYWSSPGRAAELGRVVIGTILARRPCADAAVSPALLNHVSRALAGGIDTLYGGFGNDGPKFLHASGHELLLRAWQRTGVAMYLETVAGSVTQMANGAVFDHVGGGFHRYAVDDRWRVPHFEKMLNDNALMVRLLTQLWQATKDPLFAARTRSTVEWLLREMRLPAGGFGSSLAADSPGGEGVFYLWTNEELNDALVDRAPAFFTAFEAVTDERLVGRLALVRSFGAASRTHDDAFDAELATLRAAREHRGRPLRDDKCLADWNGLAVAALAEAGLAFDRIDWIIEAEHAFAAVLRRLGAGSRLAHSAAGGSTVSDGMLDDYAAMALAALALHEATGDAAFLDQAACWEQVLDTQFWDDEEGGYFLTAMDAEQRIPRQKLIDENASPAGNGLMLAALARLHALTGRDRFRHRFEGILRCFADRMSRAGLQAATALCNSQALGQHAQIVIVGDGEAATALWQAAARHYLADRLLLRVADGATLPAAHPAYGKAALHGRPTAYVCLGPRCVAPVATVEALDDLLCNLRREFS